MDPNTQTKGNLAMVTFPNAPPSQVPHVVVYPDGTPFPHHNGFDIPPPVYTAPQHHHQLYAPTNKANVPLLTSESQVEHVVRDVPIQIVSLPIGATTAPSQIHPDASFIQYQDPAASFQPSHMMVDAVPPHPSHMMVDAAPPHPSDPQNVDKSMYHTDNEPKVCCNCAICACLGVLLCCQFCISDSAVSSE